MLSKEQLLKAHFVTEEVVEVSGGGTIKVRALTRGEALQVKGTGDLAETEQKVLSWAMVEPKLTMAEVKQWQEASPAGEIQDVFDTILRISGMEKAAQKAAYDQFREGAGS